MRAIRWHGPRLGVLRGGRVVADVVDGARREASSVDVSGLSPGYVRRAARTASDRICLLGEVSPPTSWFALVSRLLLAPEPVTAVRHYCLGCYLRSTLSRTWALPAGATVSGPTLVALSPLSLQCQLFCPIGNRPLPATGWDHSPAASFAGVSLPLSLPTFSASPEPDRPALPLSLFPTTLSVEPLSSRSLASVPPSPQVPRHACFRT
jgi:hypothetical protein